MIQNIKKQIYEMRIAGDDYDTIAKNLDLERDDCKRYYNLYSKMLHRIGMRKCPVDGKGRIAYIRAEIYSLRNNNQSFAEIAETLELPIKECSIHYEREQSRIKKSNAKNLAKRNASPKWADLNEIIDKELSGFKNGSQAMRAKSSLKAETLERYRYG